MRFTVRLTRGVEYANVGILKILDLQSALLASKAAKALLLDARAENEDAECPDGYVIFDADGEWTERHRMVIEA